MDVHVTVMTKVLIHSEEINYSKLLTDMVLHTTPTQGRSSYGGGGHNGFGDGGTLHGDEIPHLPHENLLLQRGPNRVAYPARL